MPHSENYLDRTDSKTGFEQATEQKVAAVIAATVACAMLDSYQLAKVAELMGRAGLLVDGDDPTMDTLALVEKGLDRLKFSVARSANGNGVPVSTDRETGHLVMKSSGVAYPGINVNTLAEGSPEVTGSPPPTIGYEDRHFA